MSNRPNSAARALRERPIPAASGAPSSRQGFVSAQGQDTGAAGMTRMEMMI